MIIPFNVLPREILAALLFSSNDESRYVLNSVHFELRPNRPPLIVATDGRRLCVIESESMQPDGEMPAASLTVDSGVLAAVLPFVKKMLPKAMPLQVEYHPSMRILFKMGDCVIDCEKGAVIDSPPFPNWRQVLPSGEKEPMAELGLNAETMADFAKASKALESHDGPLLRMNLFRMGGQIEVHLCGKPNFYGVVMPLEPKDEIKNWQPDFLGIITPSEKIAA